MLAADGVATWSPLHVIIDLILCQYDQLTVGVARSIGNIATSTPMLLGIVAIQCTMHQLRLVFYRMIVCAMIVNNYKLGSCKADLQRHNFTQSKNSQR